jgi:DNA-binding response OmpR family regulator
MPSRILIYGNDSLLLMTRRLILEKEGYRAFTTLELSDAIQLIMTQQLDVLVLCQSLTVEECDDVLGTVREVAPTLKIIIIGHDGSVRPNKEQEQTLQPLQGPGSLLAAVHKMVGAADGQCCDA